jgi:hypothetical protein
MRPSSPGMAFRQSTACGGTTSAPRVLFRGRSSAEMRLLADLEASVPVLPPVTADRRDGTCDSIGTGLNGPKNK